MAALTPKAKDEDEFSILNQNRILHENSVREKLGSAGAVPRVDIIGWPAELAAWFPLR